ncbi:MAG TPA: hypothetical protein DIW23_02590 [Anaerolineae bacterium]|nr:hypothetical protein [Anaerolineae bacterium]
MSREFEKAIARIYSLNYQRIVGSGFHVGDNLVLTCAHVISTQLTSHPHETLQVDFPLLAPDTFFTGKIVFWLPLQANGNGDIALIQLSDSLDSPPTLKLATQTELWGHTFRAFGFPYTYDAGIWVNGKVKGTQANGWIQIETESANQIRPGFSGAATWDERLGGVTGMISQVSATNQNTAFVIPAKTIVSACQILEKYILTHPLYLKDFYQMPASKQKDILHYYRSRLSSAQGDELFASGLTLLITYNHKEAFTTISRYVDTENQTSAYAEFLLAVALLQNRPPHALARDEALVIRSHLQRAIELDTQLNQAALLLMFINQEYFDKKGFRSQPSLAEILRLFRSGSAHPHEFLTLNELVPGLLLFAKKYFV